MRWAIRTKGIENVCLILTHKEVCPKPCHEEHSADISKTSKSNPDGCSDEDKAYLRIFEDSLAEAKAQREIAIQSEKKFSATVPARRKKALRAKVVKANELMKQEKKNLTRQRILMRDRKLVHTFTEKFPDPKGKGRQLCIIPVSNETHALHLDYFEQDNSPVLDVDEDGISDIRTFLCKAPGKARYQAYKSWVQLILREFHRIRVFTSKPRLGRMEDIVKMLNKPLDNVTGATILEQKQILEFSSVAFRDRVLELFDTFCDNVGTQCCAWQDDYPSVTIGAFVRKGGRHKPSSQRIPLDQRRTISMNAAFLSPIEEEIIPFEEEFLTDIAQCEENVASAIVDAMEIMKSCLTDQDEIGGANLDPTFELFAQEEKIFLADLRNSRFRLKHSIRYNLDHASFSLVAMLTFSVLLLPQPPWINHTTGKIAPVSYMPCISSTRKQPQCPKVNARIYLLAHC